MNFGTITMVVVAITILAIWILIRRRSPFSVSPAQIINAILSDVRINLRLVAVLSEGEQIKYFAVNGWKLYKEKIDFLRKSTRDCLTQAFQLAEDYNAQAAESKKNGTGYVGEIDTLKMYEKLRQSKASLEDWLMATTGTIEPGGKGGFFDSLLGR